MGLLYTTAAKAGFITGLYIILVPVIGLACATRRGQHLGRRPHRHGRALLSQRHRGVHHRLRRSVAGGGALFWAVHLLVLDHYSNRVAPIRLAGVQFVVCGLLSLATAFCHRNTDGERRPGGLAGAALRGPGLGRHRLYPAGGGQRGAHPAHAAIILSLEMCSPPSAACCCWESIWTNEPSSAAP